MKKSRLIPILIFTAACVSCDKAKDFADKATQTVKDQVAASGGKIASKSNKPDPELSKLVDQNAAGVVFRKDLPFPANIEVTTTRRQEWSGRIFHSSAIEKRVETVKGTRLNIAKTERKGNRVRHTVEKSSFSIPSPDDPKAAEKTLTDPLTPTAPKSGTQIFQKSNNSWAADPSGGFRSAAIAQELGPVFDEVLIENALSPRPLWFSPKKRFKPGDTLTVSGATLPMLLGGKATGTLQLKLESIDAVHGHPCAVFSVSGEYRRAEFPDLEGLFTDEEVSIQSGKLWLSIIHPIILKEEFDTIQSVSTGSKGGQKSRGQGSIKVTMERQWKAL